MSLSTEISQVVAVVCLVLMALAFVLAVVAQRRGDQRMSPLQASLLWFPMMAIFVCRYESSLNLFAQDLIVLAGGCAGCLGGVYIWRNPDKLMAPGLAARPNPIARRPRLWGFLIVLFGTGFTGYGAVSLGDFVMQPRDISGVVTKKYTRSERYGKLYHIEIEAHRFPTTADVYAEVQPLSRVHATVGRGTGNIFTATKIAPATS